MPWKVTDVMEERIRFVRQVLRGQESMSKLCREFGISRSTGYVWWNRYRGERTVGALQDRCRRPHCSPHQTPEVVEKRVVQLRHRYGWGGT
jgi:transposase-like protein